MELEWKWPDFIALFRNFSPLEIVQNTFTCSKSKFSWGSAAFWKLIEIFVRFSRLSPVSVTVRLCFFIARMPISITLFVDNFLWDLTPSVQKPGYGSTSDRLFLLILC